MRLGITTNHVRTTWARVSKRVKEEGTNAKGYPGPRS